MGLRQQIKADQERESVNKRGQQKRLLIADLFLLPDEIPPFVELALRHPTGNFPWFSRRWCFVEHAENLIEQSFSWTSFNNTHSLLFERWGSIKKHSRTGIFSDGV